MLLVVALTALLRRVPLPSYRYGAQHSYDSASDKNWVMSCEELAAILSVKVRAANASTLCPSTDRSAFENYRGKSFNERLDEILPAIVVTDLRTDTAVATVVSACAALGLRVGVHGGGHHPLGYGNPRRSVLLDLTHMREVSVDAKAMTITAQGGARFQHVHDALKPFGLIPNGGACPLVGVVGFHLGGGIGFNSRRRGLGVDSWTGATVVTADGRILKVSAPLVTLESPPSGEFPGARTAWHRLTAALRGGKKPGPRAVDPDGELLFWALKGSGHFAQLGVITSVTLRVYPHPGQEEIGWEMRQRAAESAAISAMQAAQPDLHAKRMHLAANAQARHRESQIRRNGGDAVTTAMLAGEYCLHTSNADELAVALAPIEDSDDITSSDPKAYLGVTLRIAATLSSQPWRRRRPDEDLTSVCYFLMYSGDLMEGVEKFTPFFERLANARMGMALTSSEPQNALATEVERLRTGEMFYMVLTDYYRWAGLNNASRAYVVWKSGYVYKSFSETRPSASAERNGWRSRAQHFGDVLYGANGIFAAVRRAAPEMRDQPANAARNLVVQAVYEHVGGRMTTPGENAAILTSYQNRRAKYMVSINAFVTPLDRWTSRAAQMTRNIDALVATLARDFLAASVYPEWTDPTVASARHLVGASSSDCAMPPPGYSNYGDFDLAAGRRYESAYYVPPSQRLQAASSTTRAYGTHPPWLAGLGEDVPAPVDLSISDACISQAGNERLALLRMAKLVYDSHGVFSADSDARYAPVEVAMESSSAQHAAMLPRPMLREPNQVKMTSESPKWLSKLTPLCDARLVVDAELDAEGNTVQPAQPMAGRTCVLVGASEGSLAHRTAQVLARLGCKVSVTARTKRSCEQSAASLLREIGETAHAPVCLGGFDARDPCDVRALERAIGDNIDVLVWSAAITAPYRAENMTDAPHSNDMVTLNHLAPFALVHELLRKHAFATAKAPAFAPEATPIPPRVVLVSSFATQMNSENDALQLLDPTFDFVEAWGNDPMFGPDSRVSKGELRGYGATKLMNAWLGAFLDRMLRECAKFGNCTISPPQGRAASLPTFHVAVPAVTTLTAITKRAQSRSFLDMAKGGANVAEGAASLLAAATGAHDDFASNPEGGVHVQCAYRPYSRVELMPGHDIFKPRESMAELPAGACQLFKASAERLGLRSADLELFGRSLNCL